MSNTIIETERLILRHFADSDAEAVFEFNSHPEVVRYTGEEPLKSLGEAQQAIRKIWHRDYEVQGYGRFAAVYKPDNRVIGFSGLKWESDIDNTDIGYRFLPEYWGKGLATESCIPLLRYGFEELGLHRILGLTLPENNASSNVLLKIGMEHYKTANFPGEDLLCNWYKIENPKAKPIVVSKEINCTVNTAWNALTAINAMHKWYFEQIPEFRAELGFSTKFIITNDGRTFTHRWKVTDVKPHKSIAYSWEYDEYNGKSKSTFSITPSEQGVAVTVTCTGLETFTADVPEFKAKSCRGGWEYFMTRLKEYCER